MSYLTRILKIKILKIIRNDVKWFIFEKKLFSFLYQKSVYDAHCIVNYIGPKGAMKAILFLTLEFFLCFLSYFFQNKWLLYSRIFWWGILHGCTFFIQILRSLWVRALWWWHVIICCGYVIFHKNNRQLMKVNETIYYTNNVGK